MRILLFFVVTFAVTSPAVSKPLLTNSQLSYASACIESYGSPNRLVQICENALLEGGMSNLQVANAMHSLGWARYDLGDLKAAREAFSEIRKSFPEFSQGYSGLGWMAYYKDDFTTAVPLLRQAVGNGMTARDLAGLAFSLYNIEELSLEETLQRVDAAIAMRPGYAWAMREKGWLLEDAGQFEEALTSFNAAVDADPDNAFGHYGLAWVYSNLDRWEETLAAANRAIEIRPDYYAAMSRRSLALLFLDRPKQALVDAETLIAARPEDSDGYVRQARAFNALGWNRKAREALAEAEEQVGFDEYLIYWRAHLAYDAREFPEDGPYLSPRQPRLL